MCMSMRWAWYEKECLSEESAFDVTCQRGSHASAMIRNRGKAKGLQMAVKQLRIRLDCFGAVQNEPLPSYFQSCAVMLPWKAHRCQNMAPGTTQRQDIEGIRESLLAVLGDPLQILCWVNMSAVNLQCQ